MPTRPIAEHISVDTRAYLSLRTPPTRIKRRLGIVVSSRAYRPRVDDLTSDWVAYVATPAFKLLRRQRRKPVASFCSIGTGSGLDVLAAIEILGSTRVGLTDVHRDVVQTAAENIRHNSRATHPLVVEAGFGDLLSPLRRFRPSYDLIYENLPNLPLRNAKKIAEDRTSSTRLAPRKERIPKLIKRQLLDLHYLALLQAKDFLAPRGAVLSTLGGRVPLDVFLSLARLAGYAPSFLTYTWKVQADPQEVISNHAHKQKQGYGPFHFYRADVLREAFATVDVETSGKNALAIERDLASERLDAVHAYDALQKGLTIGHTVAVLKSDQE